MSIADTVFKLVDLVGTLADRLQSTVVDGQLDRWAHTSISVPVPYARQWFIYMLRMTSAMIRSLLNVV